jgi:hypothetical protein
MHLIDNGTQVASLGAPQAASGTPGYAATGAPGTFTETILDPDIFNSTMMEIINVVLASGQTLNRTNNAQLLAAIPSVGVPVGQCRLSVASTTQLLLSPHQGRFLTINGISWPIPVAGVTLANTGLTASTLYYIYAFMSSGTMTLEAVTTTHATDTTAANYGVEIKSGDSSRSLVGMIYTDASTHFVDSVTSRTCLNWFGRRALNCVAVNSSFGISNTTIADVAAGLHLQWLTWSDEAVYTAANGNASNSTGGAATVLQLYVDGAAAGAQNVFNVSAGGSSGSYNSSTVAAFSEGLHTSEIYGNVSAGTATCNCQTNALVRG